MSWKFPANPFPEITAFVRIIVITMAGLSIIMTRRCFSQQWLMEINIEMSDQILIEWKVLGGRGRRRGCGHEQYRRAFNWQQQASSSNANQSVAGRELPGKDVVCLRGSRRYDFDWGKSNKSPSLGINKIHNKLKQQVVAIIIHSSSILKSFRSFPIELY